MHLRDVVYKANGHDITEPGHLVRLMSSMSPGDVLTLQYVRQGERGSVDIVLGKWSDHHKPAVPEWLRKLHRFLNEFPNAVDATLNVLGEDGVVHQYIITPGSLARLGADAIAVTKRGGATVEFQTDEDTVIVKHGKRVHLADLALHDRVVVLEKDGGVKALVLGLLQTPQPATRPLEGQEAHSNVPHLVRQQAHVLRDHFREIMERVKEERAHIQQAEPSEQSIERLEALKALHPEMAERVDLHIAKMRERMERMEQRLLERREKGS